MDTSTPEPSTGLDDALVASLFKWTKNDGRLKKPFNPILEEVEEEDEEEEEEEEQVEEEDEEGEEDRSMEYSTDSPFDEDSSMSTNVAYDSRVGSSDDSTANSGNSTANSNNHSMASTTSSEKTRRYFDSTNESSTKQTKETKTPQATPVVNKKHKKQKPEDNGERIKGKFDTRQADRRERVKEQQQEKEKSNKQIRALLRKAPPRRKGPLFEKTNLFEWLCRLKRDFHDPDSEFELILADMISIISTANTLYQHPDLRLCGIGIFHTENHFILGITLLPDSQKTHLINIPPCLVITNAEKKQSKEIVNEESLARGIKTHGQLKNSSHEMSKQIARYSESITCLMILALALPQVDLTKNIPPHHLLYPIFFHASLIRKSPEEIMQAFGDTKKCDSSWLKTTKSRERISPKDIMQAFENTTKYDLDWLRMTMAQCFVDQLTESESAIKDEHTKYLQKKPDVQDGPGLG